MNRLDKKWETVKTMVPAPAVDQVEGSETAIVYFGSTELIMGELTDWMKSSSKNVSTMRIKSFPFHEDVESFIEKHQSVVVLEQNQQGQMANLLRTEYPQLCGKIKSLSFCDGMPLCFEEVKQALVEGEYVG